MSDDEGLTLVFMPSLVALLRRAEELRGSPLTEDEILRVRDNAICATLSIDALLDLEKQRGYRDIDPEDCWAEWQRLRPKIGDVSGSDSTPSVR